MKHESTIEFGKRLRFMRKSLKLTQKELAFGIGVASSYISEIESGKTGPGYEFLYKLSSSYRINPFYLFHGQEPAFLEEGQVIAEASPPQEEKDYGDGNRKVHQMLWYLERSDQVKFAMLSYFSSFMVQNQSDIEKELKGKEG